MIVDMISVIMFVKSNGTEMKLTESNRTKIVTECNVLNFIILLYLM